MANRTLKQLAQEALDVQNACNLTGILGSFRYAVLELRDLLEGGGGDSHLANNHPVDHHPIVQLWADKVSSLTGTQTLGTREVLQAYAEVRKILAS